MKNFVPNTQGLKIASPMGYVDFAGVAYMGDKRVMRIELSNGGYLECTENHRVFDEDYREIFVKDLNEGTKLATLNDIPITVSRVIDTKRIEPVYDIVDVQNVSHSYWTNSILSHNCEFIQEDETLVAPLCLARLEGKEPQEVMGNIRWYGRPEANKTYLVALDPSMGTGGDYAAIQVYQLPEMIQLAEWKHHKTPARGQVQVLQTILKFIDVTMRNDPRQGSEPEIYWTFENNGCGDSVLTIINDTGEDNFPGTLMNEPKRGIGIRRKGLITSNKSKITSASRLKSLIETDRLIINSKALVSELKAYVRSGASFAAKYGSHDDLISATMLCIRLMQIMSNNDPDFNQKLKENLEIDISDNGDVEPMPIVIF